VAPDRTRHPRRRFLQGSLAVAGLGVLAGCGSLLPPARPAATVARIGYLGSTPSASPFAEAFRDGLRELGWVDGQNLTVEWRFADGREDQLAEFAAELVRLQVDVIVAPATLEIPAARSATSTIPIVFAAIGDPVGTGLVQSLARPGGNLTGLSSIGRDLSAKRLELLRSAVPAVTRVGGLWNANNPEKPPEVREMELAAQTLGLQLQSVEVRDGGDFEAAFEAMTRQRTEALIHLRDSFMNTHRAQIVGLAAKHRLPTMYYGREYVEIGGLLAYGPNAFDLFRRAATYVDKILKGAKPGDLPIEQPTKFDFVINLKTAQALGLTIPESVVQQATELIQ
jgi:putative tryptophan/tyrosine transport system substrate-binding protein